MCGIFGYIGTKKTAPSIVLTGLKTLEYRGYDSWGVAVVPEASADSRIAVKKKAGKIGKATVSDLPEGALAFGHTRWATHGGVTDKNAHPHLDCTKTIAIIHNGIVENHEALRERLTKQGHVFVSETDTEVIAHLVEEYLKKFSVLPRDAAPAFSKAVQATFNELEGLNALIVINTSANEMVAARNGSPLVVGFGDGENFLASDPVALLPHTKQVHFLEDDQMVVVTKDNIHIFDARTGERIRPKKQLLTWTADEAEKGKYPYFMLKEIHEQPGLLTEIAAESTNQAIEMAKVLEKASRIYLVGSGTSGYAAQAGSYYFATVAKKITNWSSPTEMHHHIDILPKDSVMLFLSQSGETMDLLDVVKHAKANHAKVLSLVNVVNSSLWRTSDMALPIGAGPEKGVASTKAFTATVAQLLLMAYAMRNDIRTGQSLVAQAAKACREVLKSESVTKIQEVARSLKSSEHLFVVGRGISYSTVLECALKIKEISYIHAEGISAGELKHGPLALITKSATCIVYAPNDVHHATAIANAMEMKARGARIIGISPVREEVFDEYIPVPDVGEVTIIPNVVIGQLLAYYLTIERGFDPDMPRNLAKSVTVK